MPDITIHAVQVCLSQVIVGFLWNGNTWSRLDTAGTTNPFGFNIVWALSRHGKPNYVDFICDGHRNITIHRFQNIFQNTFQNIFQETFVGIITTAAVHVRIYRHFIHNVLRKDHKVFEKNWDAVNYRMLSDSPGTAIKGANIDASRLHQFADRCRQSMINRERHRQHYMPHKMCVPVHSV